MLACAAGIEQTSGAARAAGSPPPQTAASAATSSVERPQPAVDAPSHKLQGWQIALISVAGVVAAALLVGALALLLRCRALRRAPRPPVAGVAAFPLSDKPRTYSLEATGANS